MGEPSQVGMRELQLQDGEPSALVRVFLLYPTAERAASVSMGAYSLEVARDAPPVGADLRWVVVSHGNSSTPWAYRDLLTYLARAGFEVVAVEHPGNNARDNNLAGTPQNLIQRPRQLRLAIDAALADPCSARTSRRAPSARSVIRSAPTACSCSRAATRSRSRTRRRALAARTPSFHSELILRGVPDPARVSAAQVQGAGHFSFNSPFPATMVSPNFPPSQDPEGFDCARYLPQLYEEIATFLRAKL